MPVKEETPSRWCCYPTAQAYILARPNKTPEFRMSDMTVLSNKDQEGLVAGVCWFKYDFCQAVYNFSWWREKEPGEIRKRHLGEMKLMDWPKYSRCFPKESSVLSKRSVDSKQKNRRCSAKESTMLKGSSQYTFRKHLTAMPWEVVIRDNKIVKL